MNTVNCASCGAELQRPNSKIRRCKQFFCDYKCAGHWRKGVNNPRYTESVVTNCANCGGVVVRTASQHERNEGNFCNKECYGAWRARELVGERAPRWTAAEVECTCEHCGKHFKRLRSQLKSEVFCSQKCNDDHHSVSKPCTVCGKTIRVPLNTAKKHKEQFCDHKCFGVWKSENINGENHPRWAGGAGRYYGNNWLSQRRKALRRDHYRCQECKRFRGQEGIRLNVHHVKPFRLFGYVPGENSNYIQANDLGNLITYCASCHGKLEPREKQK